MFELLVVARKGQGAQLSYLGGAGVEGGQGSNDYNYGALLGGNAFSARLVSGWPASATNTLSLAGATPGWSGEGSCGLGVDTAHVQWMYLSLSWSL
jgi:hypothetical protein